MFERIITNRSSCSGTLVCMTLVDKMRQQDDICMDCTILRQTQQLPEWLSGTPIFIDARRQPSVER